MGAIRELLDGAPGTATPVLRPFGPGDLGWVVARSGELYAEEYGWNARIETLAAKELAEWSERADPARERGWIAEVDGRRAGSVLCMRREEGVAQLRMLLVDPAARGLGIGGLLVDECMRFAREVGYREMVLWTTSVLSAARRIYARAGFEVASQEPFDGFGPALTAELWRRAL
jgi:GNAT superfamily N-acetyltransferase